MILSQYMKVQRVDNDVAGVICGRSGQGGGCGECARVRWYTMSEQSGGSPASEEMHTVRSKKSKGNVGAIAGVETTACGPAGSDPVPDPGPDPGVEPGPMAAAAAARSAERSAARASCFCWRSDAETPGGGAASCANTCAQGTLVHYVLTVRERVAMPGRGCGKCVWVHRY